MDRLKGVDKDTLKIERTKRRRLPWLYVLGKQARIWDLQYWSYLKRVREFSKVVKWIDGDMVYLKDGWALNLESAELMAREMKEWGYYLPEFSLKGKTILDVGADCGSTARFYLKQGAKEIICVDNDPVSIAYLFHNKIIHPLKVIPQSFDVAMLLDFDYDFCKIDIEGYEVLLIDALKKDLIGLPDLKPTVIEAHSQYCINELTRHGFKVRFSYRSDLKIMSNY